MPETEISEAERTKWRAAVFEGKLSWARAEIAKLKAQLDEAHGALSSLHDVSLDLSLKASRCGGTMLAEPLRRIAEKMRKIIDAFREEKSNG